MQKFMKSMVLIAALAFAHAAAHGTGEQMPVTQEPHHRVVYEDSNLRVLDVNVPPKTMTADHRHDHDIATVSISAADTRTISPGQPWGPVRPRRPVGNVSTTEYTGKAGSHTVENVGDTLYRLIAIENLREGNWSAGVPLSAPATTLQLETRAFRVYDVKLSGSAATVRHAHTAPVVAALASGRVVATAGSSLTVLGQPGQWIMIPPGQAHQLSAADPPTAHVVEIEVR